MIKLNVGCGSNYMEGYTNIDFSDTGSNGKPIRVDLMIDLLDNKNGGIMKTYMTSTVDEIYFSEVLEHFNRQNGFFVLTTLYDILKPGGKLTLTVPNSFEQMKRLIIKMSQYKNSEDIDDFFNAHENVKYWKWHDDLMGATHRSNGRDGDSHKTLYSYASLKSIVEKIGFKIVSADENRIMMELTK